MVLQLAPKCNTSVAFLADIRFLFYLLIGYSGIFRISEILQLRIKDISAFSEHMNISGRKRKNDQYKNGPFSVRAKSRETTCPVAVKEKLLSLLPDVLSSSSKNCFKIEAPQCKVSRFTRNLLFYSQGYGQIIYISSFVSDPRLYGTHSLRSGDSNDPGLGLISELHDRQGELKNSNPTLHTLNLITPSFPGLLKLCIFDKNLELLEAS